MPPAGVAFTFALGLFDMATPGAILVAPPLVTGDVLLSRDFGALTPMATLPAETPAGSGMVVGTVSNSEMLVTQGVSVLFHDGTELVWGDAHLYLEVLGPHYGIAYQRAIVLYDAATPGTLLAAPPISVGDFKLSKDGGALANLTTLPVETPAGSRIVLLTLTATEMQATRNRIIWHRADGAWGDGLLALDIGAQPSLAGALLLAQTGVPTLRLPRGRLFPVATDTVQNQLREVAEDGTAQVVEFGPTRRLWEVVLNGVDAATLTALLAFLEHTLVRWGLHPFTLTDEVGGVYTVRYWAPFPFRGVQYAAGISSVTFQVREEI